MSKTNNTLDELKGFRPSCKKCYGRGHIGRATPGFNIYVLCPSCDRALERKKEKAREEKREEEKFQKELETLKPIATEGGEPMK